MLDLLSLSATAAVFTFRALVVLSVFLLARVLAWLVNMMIFAPPFDPLRHLPGPEGTKLQNHFREVMDPSASPDTYREWTKAFGRTYRFHGFGSHDFRLMTLDKKAVSYILSAPVFEKPWQTRAIVAQMLGRGIFGMEGEEHKVQRKLMVPAFSTSAVKAMTPIFQLKADELRERWEGLINAPANDKKESTSIIDVAQWFSRATFDVIGLGGFDYPFDALKRAPASGALEPIFSGPDADKPGVHDGIEEEERLYRAYREMFGIHDKGPGFMSIVRLFNPILDTILPDDNVRTNNRCRKEIAQSGKRIVASKKAAVLAEGEKDMERKDLLSILIKANLSGDPTKRLTDDELLDQVSTFLFAGSDSTAMSLSWALHLLATHPEDQAALRAELAVFSSQAKPTPTIVQPEPVTPTKGGMTSRLPTPPPTPERTPSPGFAACSAKSPTAFIDGLDGLPLLDGIVRESLRLSPPVHGIIRTAKSDTTIPLSEPVLLRNGRVTREVSIRRGSYIHVPIEGMNYDEGVWGADARAFRPARWSSSEPTSEGLAGLMTFSMGPSACPGYKFALLEMKVFLASILPHFVFKPVGGDVKISKFNAIITRPFVENKFSHGPQLPVKVERYLGD